MTSKNSSLSGQADCEERALLIVAATVVFEVLSLFEFGEVTPDNELRLLDIIQMLFCFDFDV